MGGEREGGGSTADVVEQDQCCAKCEREREREARKGRLFI
jgi:hypothetical protein